VLGISDGSIIAREVDYVILVVQHRRFPREVSLRAKRAIEEVHGNCVGMVLNAVAVKSDDSYYYYSSYGSYYDKPNKRRRKKKPLNGTGEPEVKTVRMANGDGEEF
jgi:Mrp family chromosome partitioning ATPase